MLFTDPCFLFFFLPIVLVLYYLAPHNAKNGVLIAASVLFYAVGEGVFTALVVFSILFNYLLGRMIDARARPAAKLGLIIGIVVNLSLIAAFKYANFFVQNLNAVLPHLGLRPMPLPNIALPLGISFFTFHALSCLIDIWRREVPAMKRPSRFALYMLLFPQLIAGPIIRYKTICDQLAAEGRTHTWDKFADGVRRFIIGLSKKMLIANIVGREADLIFSLKAPQIAPAVAWLGALCYALQIYFDFSGYSDMAIGLGRMFGFVFPENFNLPYAATSITDFWRRWHMTLSSWFRDYLYIPLGGNRSGPWRTYLNLLIVFFLCGLWHGAMWTFVAWGLFHGLFLILERVGLQNVLDRHRLARHVYVMLVVLVGWVFFRAPSISSAGEYLLRMTFLGTATSPGYEASLLMNQTLLMAVAAGIFASLPLGQAMTNALKIATQRAGERATNLHAVLFGFAEMTGLATIFLLSVAMSARNTYNPFIYFRF